MLKSTLHSVGRVRLFRTLAAVLAAPLLAGVVTAADAAYVLRAAGGFRVTAAAPTEPQPGPQAVLVLSTANVDFGSVTVTDSATATVTLSNSGAVGGAVAVTGPAAPFSLAHDCPAELASASSCTLFFTYSPTAAGNVTRSAFVAGQEIALGGFGEPLGPNLTLSTTSVDFGLVTVGGYATQVVTLTNSGGVAGSVSLVAPAEPYTVTHNCPATLNPAASCKVTYRLSPTVDGVVSGTATIAGVSVALTGTGNSSKIASWSSAYASLTAPSPAFLNFGTRTTGATLNKEIWLRNTGTNGQLAVGFTLSGDVSQFKIVAVQKQELTGNGMGVCGATIAGDGASASTCTTDDVAGGLRPQIKLTVAYTPTGAGSHSITITPNTSNGTALPGAVVMTGYGEFNPTASWSSAYASLTAPSPAFLNFGTRTTGTTLNKEIWLRNTGTNGQLAVGFTLSGDVSQFKIVAVQKQYLTSANVGVCGATIAGDGASASTCTTDDVAGGLRPQIKLTVAYTPTGAGSHSITITPNTSNGTALPGAVVMTGYGN